MMKLKKKIIDLFPLKAQFKKKEIIEIVIEFLNDESRNLDLTAVLKVLYLDEVTDTINLKINLKPLELKKINVNINPKNDDFCGYGVDVYLYEQDKVIQILSTSFDVVSSWKKSTRYGFLSDFYDKDKDDLEDLQEMRKLHINLVQFYDWMYKHDELLPVSTEFTDPMGRVLNFEVIKEKIRFCHRYGMKAIAYGAIYAASESFYNNHKNWVLYDSNNKVIRFIDSFFIMNISKDCPWHWHIINQYKKALIEADFDGIHMDTYGFPKAAISKLNNIDKVENLDEQFPIIINNARKILAKYKEDLCIIFNNVGNWPIESTANTDVDAIYIEVWKPYERYYHLKELIMWGKYLSKGKPVILAAYLKQYIDYEDKDIDKANNSLLLITAIIASNGGYHMLLGEKNGVLTEGYYVDYYTVDDKFFRIIRNYYDFIIRYSNIFFNDNLKDVSMTHIDGDNLEYTFENVDYSTYGEPGKVWITARENKKCKELIFINLTNNYEDFWNRGKNKPELIKNIIVNIQIERKVRKIFYASPDFEMGRPEKIDYSISSGTRGKILNIQIPKLYIWSILIIEFELSD